MIWRHLNGKFQIGSRPLLMGILNVTPDSFSDGGKFFLQDQALAHAEKLIREGVDILDVGGESTRPGAEPVPEQEELKRVLPVIESIQRSYPYVVLSIDTYKARVAERSVQSGVSIINDVGAGLWDQDMPQVLKKTRAAYVCMHAQGFPGNMQSHPTYQDVGRDVFHFLKQRKEMLLAMGIAESSLAFDPGIGFGKKLEHNLDLIRQASDFFELGRPILWGLSRKSFISQLLGVTPENRLAAGLAAYASLWRQGGAQIWRVHEVAEHLQFIKMLEATRSRAD
jgi:dihydropteroate synthase